MSVSKETIVKLVDRLVRMPAQVQEDFGVKVKDIRDDIGRAIQRHAVSDDHANRAIQSLIEQSKFRPQEAEIREFCMNTSAQSEDAPERPKCSICHGMMFVTVWMLVTYRGNSFEIAKAERLSFPGCATQADEAYEAMEFDKKLADKQRENPGLTRQVVMSAAKPCVCRSSIANVA